MCHSPFQLWQVGEFCVLFLGAEEGLWEKLLLVSGPSGLLQKLKFTKEMTLGLGSGGGVYFPPGAGAGGEVSLATPGREERDHRMPMLCVHREAGCSAPGLPASA